MFLVGVIMKQQLHSDRKLKMFLLPSFLAMAVLCVLFLITDAIVPNIVVTSIGASTFIAFTMPQTRSAKLRCLIGGYVIGLACGAIMNCAHTFFATMVRTNAVLLQLFFYAGAVGLTMFFMLLSRCEHPPAAALALSLVSETKILPTIIVALISILIISLVKVMLQRWLINLIE
jgi:CBS-domain-containing membrane protein